MSTALLRLQDDHGVDVVVLLVLLYAATTGAALDPAAVRRLVLSAADWRRQVVEPLRAARRALKLNARDPAGELYIQVKRAELAAEEAAIRYLAEALPVGSTAPSRAEAVRAAAGNLEAYRSLLDLPAGPFDHVVSAFGDAG